MEYSCKHCKFFRNTKRLVDGKWDYSDNVCIIPIVYDWDDFPLIHVTEEEVACECFEIYDQEVSDDSRRENV